MKKILLLALSLTSTSAVADPVPFVQPSGEAIEWSAHTGKLPAFVFAGTGITDAEAKFICSEKHGAVWAVVSDKTYAINSAAHGLAVGLDGKVLDVVDADSKDNTLTTNNDVATRIVGQASRVCDIPEMRQAANVSSGDSPIFIGGRKIYAIVEATTDYCPNVERRWGVLSAIKAAYGYAPPTTEAELMALNQEKQKVFATLRSVGRRAGCEYMMDQYGPGGDPELFQFK